MDDDKTISKATYRVTIAGEEYEFGEPDPELLQRMVLVNHMNAGLFMTLESVTKWMASAAGPVVWGTIMRRFLNDEVDAQDLMTAMSELVALAVGKQDASSDAA